jgi:1-acyl-sn-glycerol-3-phosphate acyltransferase
MSAFAACLPLPGLLMPAAFALHYRRLIAYEETALGGTFGSRYSAYAGTVPRLVPTLRSLRAFLAAWKTLAITPEGARHNALYALFVPGLLAAAATGSFPLAVAIGLPAVLDWAIIHTRIGIGRLS